MTIKYVIEQRKLISKHIRQIFQVDFLWSFARVRTFMIIRHYNKKFEKVFDKLKPGNISWS